MDYSKRILDICEILNISSYELWKKTGLAKSTFYNLISKKAKDIRIDKVFLICDVLSISIKCFEVSDEELRNEVLTSYWTSRLSKMSDEEFDKLVEYYHKIKAENNNSPSM